MDTDEILRQVWQHYRSCSSYTDTGSLSSNIGDVQFRTYFCRPNKFRFEWSISGKKSGTSVIFSNSDTNATYMDREKRTETGGLAMAIAGATGISFGAAPLIAHILMPDLFEASQYQSLASLSPYRFVKEDNSCFEICADWRANCSTALLVDKNEPAIRKIEITISPTLEEKKRGVEALELLQAPELEEVRALLIADTKPTKTVISYDETIFDMPICADMFEGAK